MRESGHNPADIRHLVLTHGHIDHAGSAAEVRRCTGVRTYAHAIDLELINKGKVSAPALTLRLDSFLPSLICFLLSTGERHTNLSPLIRC